MRKQRLEMGKLVRENRQLRTALETLLDELDASNAKIQTGKVRDSMPDPPGQSDGIKPPGRSEEAKPPGQRKQSSEGGK